MLSNLVLSVENTKNFLFGIVIGTGWEKEFFWMWINLNFKFEFETNKIIFYLAYLIITFSSLRLYISQWTWNSLLWLKWLKYCTNYNCSQAHNNSSVVVASKLLEKKCSKKNIYFNELTNPTIYVHITHSSRW